MVQWLNIPGIRAAWRAARDASVIAPHCAVTDIRQCNFADLRARGYRYVIFDKDNCIALPYSNTLHSLVKDAWAECLGAFGKENVVIVSNSAGSCDDKGFAEAQSIEQGFGVPVLRHPSSKKPECISDILHHFSITQDDAHRCVVIGDRLLTDVYMGKRLGGLTIHTQPFTEQGDATTAIVVRRFENWLLRTVAKPLGFPPDPQ
ncbi:hypothetical protein PTSG_00921 [Salpingoeca rosetta]|uniref:Uncharacterized protein n=1 Tax=Salpingoeca rosetta (strain ATCC 50818 / BSB-021) TaxID=946362 RepID=F2TXV9_SALR5|nr:uncharacterized protein PTSG_00921 [Salpingoeca rosetta]EGD76218.1 hypothetical protein PTSG_00921 [Salpingoeca rosetta]|eukprot:XP_004998393.1 hypothetical protein PTSG_00921 [Salpingoeca rosetta]